MISINTHLADYMKRSVGTGLGIRSLLCLYLCLGSMALRAQDIQFSQFYATSMYANPALAGGVHSGRIMSHSRYQWPRLDARYLTTFASFDFFLPKINSGFGILGLYDSQGSKNISTSEVQLFYAYELPVSEAYTFRFGLQGGYVSRSINYSILNFPDQFSVNGPLDIGTAEPFGASKVSFLDVSSGMLLYSKKVWIGLAGHHLNMPNQSFYNQRSELPIKATLSGGYKFIISQKSNLGSGVRMPTSVVPSFNYKMQGKSDQLDLGLYFLRETFMSGIWYRGLPVIKQYNRKLQNNESIALLVGFKNKDFSISYSYDFVVSKLNKARPGGAHELNITYLFEYPKRQKKKYRPLPCPDFYKD